MSPLFSTVVFTIVIPGTVTVLLPFLILDVHPGVHVGVLRWTGLVLSTFGMAAYAWCAWDFVRVGKGTPAPIAPPKELVARGLYRIVRNPMYVGVILILSGEVLWFGSVVLLGYTAVVFLLFNLFIFSYEEPNLRRRFGGSYDAYCRSVPRWIPRIRRSPMSF